MRWASVFAEIFCGALVGVGAKAKSVSNCFQELNDVFYKKVRFPSFIACGFVVITLEPPLPAAQMWRWGHFGETEGQVGETAGRLGETGIGG